VSPIWPGDPLNKEHQPAIRIEVSMFRRVLTAANAIFFAHLIARLGALFLVPLYLKYWSPSLYGEYLALSAAVSYFASLDIGMQQAAINRMTKAFAKGDFEDYRSVQHTALAFYLALAVGGTCLAAVFFQAAPISHWIGLRLTAPTTARSVLGLLAAYFVWSMPMRLIGAAYQTMGNLARSQWIANAQQILVVLLCAAALVFGGGMLATAAVQLSTVPLVVGFVLFGVWRSSPAYFPGIGFARLSILKELAHPSLLFALLLVGNLIAFQGSTLLISATIGSIAVVVLSVSKAIIDVIRQALYSITLALCPEFARMEALGQREELRRAHRLILAATGAITLALAADVWYEGPQIITLWTHGRVEPDVTLLRLFLVLLVLQTPWAASSTVATATNRHQVQAVGYFVAAIAGIGASAALVPYLGTWAVPVGLTLGESLGCYHFVIKASCRMIGEPYAAFAMRFWLGFAVVTAAVLAIAGLVHYTLNGLTVVRWLVMGFLTFSVAATCAWRVWLTPDDRAVVLPKLRPVLRLSSVRA
jgi:O-antigen/teichoic acid export membrane protein